MARKRKVGFSGSLGVIAGEIGRGTRLKKGPTPAQRTAKKLIKARKFQKKLFKKSKLAKERARAVAIKRFAKKNKSIYD